MVGDIRLPKLKYIFQWFRDKWVAFLLYSLNEPVLRDVEQGQVKLRVGDSVTLLDVERRGTIGGMINCAAVGGPNELVIDFDLYSEIPVKHGEYAATNYLHVTVKRTEGEMFSPIVYIEPTYAPHGGRITLTQSNGLECTYTYHVYRK